ncbi:MAG: cysteine rich repeat-containing protein [Syntrophobacteraceae bacterium]
MKPDRLMVQPIIVAAMSMSLGLLSQSFAFAAGACQGDIARYCRGVQGPKQEMECLKEHKEQLSRKCKMHIVQVLRAVKEAHQDCEADIYVFCQGVKPGKGRIIGCLKAHKQELTPECKAGILDLLMSR